MQIIKTSIFNSEKETCFKSRLHIQVSTEVGGSKRANLRQTPAKVVRRGFEAQKVKNFNKVRNFNVPVSILSPMHFDFHHIFYIIPGNHESLKLYIYAVNRISFNYTL